MVRLMVRVAANAKGTKDKSAAKPSWTIFGDSKGESPGSKCSTCRPFIEGGRAVSAKYCCRRDLRTANHLGGFSSVGIALCKSKWLVPS